MATNQSPQHMWRDPNKSTEVQQKQESVLLESFLEWQQMPMTKKFLQALKNHRESCVSAITGGAGAVEIPDVFFRIQGVNIKNTETIIEMATNFKALQQRLE